MKDKPLKIEVSDGRLLISIGIETLAFCAQPENGGPLYDGAAAKEIRVREGAALALAEDVKSALEREDDAGNTILNRALDDAIREAHDNGSDAFEYVKGRVR